MYMISRTDKNVHTKIGFKKIKNKLLGGESNPGLLCDRQGCSPLYYQGLVEFGDYNTN